MKLVFPIRVLILTPFFDLLIIPNTWSVAVGCAVFFFAGVFCAGDLLVVFALMGFAVAFFATLVVSPFSTAAISLSIV